MPFSALLSFYHLSAYLWNLDCYDGDVSARMYHDSGQFSAHQHHQAVRLRLSVQGFQIAHYLLLGRMLLRMHQLGRLLAHDWLILVRTHHH